MAGRKIIPISKHIFTLFSPLLAYSLSYDVHFSGLSNPDALLAIENSSELVSLKDRPPASINGLRYRINADIPEFLRTLRAFSYYDATITSQITHQNDTLQVAILIDPGPQYSLRSYQIFSGFDCMKLASIPNCNPLDSSELGLHIGKPVTSIDIVNAELDILFELSRCGYPLAEIDKRRVIVDMQDKKIEAAACVQEGPLTKFGPTSLFGVKDIKPEFIERKISWKEGETYNTDLVVQTQERLLKTELFSSALISHGEHLDAQGELPMKMRITEAKYQKISLAAFYGTVDGPGGTIEWRHKNIRGMGEILSLKGDFSEKYYVGVITYKKPDFLVIDQSWRTLFAASHEKINPYLAMTYRGATYLDRKVNAKTSVSFGLKYENINVKRSATNGSYSLFGLPIFARYDTSNDLLDPTRGYTLVYSITPYQSVMHVSERFAKQRFTATCYIPLWQKWITLALRGQVGSIAGAKQSHMPLPKLFLGGTEDDLRGYKYKTVSPLDAGGKPLGGRSAIFTTIELRLRVMEKIGIVPFADFGTVTLSEMPQVSAPWFKSVGGGLRYFSFFGPLRFDIGFPLNKRKHLDSNFRVYASIGQAF